MSLQPCGSVLPSSKGVEQLACSAPHGWDSVETALVSISGLTPQLCEFILKAWRDWGWLQPSCQLLVVLKDLALRSTWSR